jgi:hypothetical protein
MIVRFYIDPETDEPHIYDHGFPKRRSRMSSGTLEKTAPAGTTLGSLVARQIRDATCGWSIWWIPTRVASSSLRRMI